MREISRVCNKEKTNHNKVIYDFDKKELYNARCDYTSKMSKSEYEKVKAQTIKRAKKEKWNLTFEIIIKGD